MDALAALLTRERLLIELVVFKLVELRQLLLAGETRFLGWAAEEVERATSTVREAEIERAVLCASVAEARALGRDATLSEIIADTPEPWRTVLSDAQTALRASAVEVTELLQTTRRLSEAGSRSLSETLRRLDGSAPEEPALTTYGPTATWTRTAPRPRVHQSL